MRTVAEAALQHLPGPRQPPAGASPSGPPCSDSHYQGNVLPVHTRLLPVHTCLPPCTPACTPTCTQCAPACPRAHPRLALATLHKEGVAHAPGAGPAWAQRPACAHGDAATSVCTRITLTYVRTCTTLPGSDTPPHVAAGLLASGGGTPRDEKNTEGVDTNPPGAAGRVHVRQPLHTNTGTHIPHRGPAKRLRSWGAGGQAGARLGPARVVRQSSIPHLLKLLLFRRCFQL